MGVNATQYITITETPGSRATQEQLRILFTRYHLARQYSVGCRVLDIAAGCGIGVGMVASVANKVVAGDLNEISCRTLAESYQSRTGIYVVRADAQNLPFSDSSFDTVLLFEAIYYLLDVDAFLRGASRVLRPGGVVIISSVNPRWRGFNPSPFSVKYFTPEQLSELLGRHSFRVRVLAGFPEVSTGGKSGLLSAVRATAVRWGLIPKTMRGKEWLKGVFYGRLQLLPNEIPYDAAIPAPLVDVTQVLHDPSTHSHYKMLYFIADSGGPG